MVAIDPKHEKQIQKQYKCIGTEYQGNITDMVLQIKDLKTKLDFANKENVYKLKEKDYIIELKDEKLKYQELKNEVLEMKLHLASV